MAEWQSAELDAPCYQWGGFVGNYLCMIKFEGSHGGVGKGDSPADAHLLVQDND